MFTNRKNFFIILYVITFIFVGLITFAVPVNSQTGTNLITFFVNGSPHSYNTLNSSGNNIIQAVETSGPPNTAGGAVSNPIIYLNEGQPYTLTYTLTLNSGTAPNIRLVSGRDGRSNYTYPQNSGLNIVAQTGTRSYVFTPTFASGYLEVSVTSGAKTNFSMTNISVVYSGTIKEYTGKYVIESPSSSPFVSSTCLDGSALVGFNLDNMGDNYKKIGSLYCWGTSANLGDLGPVTQHSNKFVVESPNQIDLSTCPSGSVLVGFNLDDMGDDYKKTGSLYCREFQGGTVNLETVTKYPNKYVIESPYQMTWGTCPNESVLVGFNLDNVGINFSRTGSLYCRKITLAPPPPTSIPHSTTFNLTVTESTKPAPTNVTVVQGPCNGTSATSASLEISWDKIQTAKEYKLYRIPTTPAEKTSPVTVEQPTSGATKVVYLDKGLVSKSDLGYGYEISAVYPNGESIKVKSVPWANPTKECLSNESSVSLSCSGISDYLPACVVEYNSSLVDGLVSLTPIGSGWNSCTPSSIPTHSGWNGGIGTWLVSTPIINPAYVYPTSSNLLAYYKFDDGTAPDFSGSDNNGTVNGATATAGEFDGALSFNGTTNYVDTKDFSFSKDESFTFSVWAKTPSFTASKVIFGKPNPNWEYTFMTDGTNAVRFVYWNTTGSRGAIEMYSPSNSFPNNTWTHFVISYNGPAKQAKMYINGIEKASHSSVSDAFQNRTNNLWIGAGYYAWAQRYFNGSIDDFRIYNRALTANEVQALYYNDFKASGDKYAAGSLIKNQYEFKFSCEKDGGLSYDFEKVNVCVKPPVVPITATAQDSSSIKVEWTKPNIDPVFDLTYTLKRWSTNPNDKFTVCSDKNINKCTDDNLSANTNYTYQLETSTTNLCGTGLLTSLSATKNVTTPVLVIPDFSLSATGPIKITSIGSTAGKSSTATTITINPSDGFDKNVQLSLESVTKNGATIEIAKFIPNFSYDNLDKNKYLTGSTLTIKSNEISPIDGGKYILKIKGVGDGVVPKYATVELTVNAFSFFYREY
ncbi:MAG: LamG-like jellyroll fold domain-containing protein [Candidatus Paceibacterota bacterium]|jgi:hypothetical protein